MASCSGRSRIINVSASGIGSFSSLTTVELAKYVTDNGANLVVSAGAGSSSNSHASIANIPGVIVVGNMRSSLEAVDVKNPNTDIIAPGFEVYRIDRNMGGGVNSGTSLSAPVVSATIALMLNVAPCLTTREIEEIIKNTAQPVSNADNPGDEYYGFVGAGRLNTYLAVLAAQGGPVAPITGNETWDSPRIVDGDVVIQTGGKLTITSTIRFGQNSQIIVEPGGQLIVDGGTLTIGCDANSWQGIRVEGNSALSQIPVSNQGFVRLIDATVEFAEKGVWASSDPGNSSGGGIIRATNTLFRNCEQAVQMLPFINTLPSGNPFSDLSSFQDCIFTLDKNSPFTTGSTHVRIDGVSGISFNGCTFTDNRTDAVDPIAYRAIQSIDSKYNVFSSEFSNMDIGIEAYNFSSLRTFTVTGSIFKANQTGIYARGVNHFRVTDGNTFHVGTFAGTASSELTFPDRQVGIFIDQCTGFEVQDNTFTGNLGEPTPITDAGIGIVARNTNISQGGITILDYNQIYRNDLGEINFGNLANGLNAGSIESGGLHYLCNRNGQAAAYGDNSFDFTVAEGSVSPLQFDPLENSAAANRFSLSGNFSFSDWDNSSGNVIRYFYNPNGFADEDPQFVDPSRFFRMAEIRNECDLGLDDDDDIPGPIREDMLTELGNQRVLYDSKRTLFLDSLDQGDTPGTIALIQSVTALTRSSTRSQLVGFAPWLSAEAAVAVIENGVFSGADKVAILEGNPETLRQPQVQAVIHSSEVFTQQQLEDLQGAASLQSSRTDLEIALDGHLGQVNRLANQLIRHHLRDSLPAMHMDTVRQLLRIKGSLEAAYAEVDAYLQQGNASQAQTKLNQIPFQYPLNAEQQASHQDVVSLKNIQMACLNSSRSFDSLTTGELQTLETLAEADQGLASLQAQNWLNAYFGGDYRHEPLLGGETVLPRQKRPAANALNRTHTGLRAFPNPAGEWVHFEVEVPPAVQRAQLLITDVNGRPVHLQNLTDARWTWATGAVPAGQYFVQVLLDGEAQPAQRLVLIK